MEPAREDRFDIIRLFSRIELKDTSTGLGILGELPFFPNLCALTIPVCDKFIFSSIILLTFSMMSSFSSSVSFNPTMTILFALVFLFHYVQEVFDGLRQILIVYTFNSD